MKVPEFYKTHCKDYPLWNFVRVFYQNAPEFAKTVMRYSVSGFLKIIDIAKRLFRGRERYMIRGTSNQETINNLAGCAAPDVPGDHYHGLEQRFAYLPVQFSEAGVTHSNP
jgi:hypothetical protein